jgi:uncharacterized tellurite resistance protein B-like protein
VLFTKLEGQRLEANTKLKSKLQENIQATTALVQARGDLVVKVCETQGRIYEAAISAAQRISKVHHEFKLQQIEQEIKISEAIGNKILTIQNIKHQIKKQGLKNEQELELIMKAHEGDLEQLALVRHKIQSEWLSEEAKQAQLRGRIQIGIIDEEL